MVRSLFGQLTTMIQVLLLLLILVPRPVQANTTPTVTQVLTTATTPTGTTIIVVPALRVKIGDGDGEPSRTSLLGATGNGTYAWQGALLQKDAAINAIRQAKSTSELDALSEAIEAAILQGTVDAELGVILMTLVDQASGM